MRLGPTPTSWSPMRTVNNELRNRAREARPAMSTWIAAVWSADVVPNLQPKTCTTHRTAPLAAALSRT